MWGFSLIDSLVYKDSNSGILQDLEQWTIDEEMILRDKMRNKVRAWKQKKNILIVGFDFPAFEFTHLFGVDRQPFSLRLLSYSK
jgi:hypothetical protein